MNALDEFRSTLPAWRMAVEEWLDRQPAWFRNDPAWAGSVYLLGAPPLVALGSMTLKSLEEGWINWEQLLGRADAAGDVEAALARAAYGLAQGDPGAALGLMLLFPAIEVFRWAHAAGTLYLLVNDRRHLHPLLG
jgi:hypothetical protein